jgi:hypothetical protein
MLAYIMNFKSHFCQNKALQDVEEQSINENNFYMQLTNIKTIEERNFIQIIWHKSKQQDVSFRTGKSLEYLRIQFFLPSNGGGVKYYTPLYKQHVRRLAKRFTSTDPTNMKSDFLTHFFRIIYIITNDKSITWGVPQMSTFEKFLQFCGKLVR